MRASNKHGSKSYEKSVREPEYAMFSVALRELLDLAQSTMHQNADSDGSI